MRGRSFGTVSSPIQSLGRASGGGDLPIGAIVYAKANPDPSRYAQCSGGIVGVASDDLPFQKIAPANNPAPFNPAISGGALPANSPCQIYGNGRWIVTGNNAAAVFRSDDDGATLAGFAPGPSSEGITGGDYVNGNFIIYTNSGAYYFSPDGGAFTKGTLGAGVYIYHVAYGLGFYLFATSNGLYRVDALGGAATRVSSWYSWSVAFMASANLFIIYLFNGSNNGTFSYDGTNLTNMGLIADRNVGGAVCIAAEGKCVVHAYGYFQIYRPGDAYRIASYSTQPLSNSGSQLRMSFLGGVTYLSTPLGLYFSYDLLSWSKMAMFTDVNGNAAYPIYLPGRSSDVALMSHNASSAGQISKFSTKRTSVLLPDMPKQYAKDGSIASGYMRTAA